MKSFDPQIIALSGKIKHHLSYDYKSPDNRARNQDELYNEVQQALKFPIVEVTPSVWDEMIELAEMCFLVAPKR